ncbi:MAG: MmgE/PrpD family protein [Burkholderiales bacterium]
MTTISETLAAFVETLDYDRIPEPVIRRAKHLMLDAAGIALASSTYDFARKTVDALARFGNGDAHVIGFPTRLPLRDAVTANGVLMHGLDYDDTYQMGSIHATSSCFPTALAVAAERRLSGRDLITAYVAAMESATRIAAVARGDLIQIGFHPTGMIAAFGCALGAGKLYGLDREALVMAQGIVLSMAAGAREYSSNASWTKRLHPGWAGACGITAAVLAQGGFTGPRTTYEGKFGLYATHWKRDFAPDDLAAATRGLGESWETLQVAFKPFPVGHFNISFIYAAQALAKQHAVRAEDIEAIEVLVPPNAVKVVCEPVADRKRPANSYAAQFSVQYAVACTLIRGCFGLQELELYRDPTILALADKVSYRLDPNTGYPKAWSGEVIVTLKNGKRVAHREQVNRGAPDNPLAESDIVSKFMENAEVAVSRAQAERIRDRLLTLESARDSAAVAALLASFDGAGG